MVKSFGNDFNISSHVKSFNIPYIGMFIKYSINFFFFDSRLKVIRGFNFENALHSDNGFVSFASLSCIYNL